MPVAKGIENYLDSPLYGNNNEKTKKKKKAKVHVECGIEIEKRRGSNRLRVR